MKQRTSTWEICHTQKDISFITGNLSEFVKETDLDISDVRYAITKARAESKNWCELGGWRIFWHYLDKSLVNDLSQVKTATQRVRFFEHLIGRPCLH